jgi:two-component system, NtrC family, nitrogen regulation response regulator NtrX
MTKILVVDDEKSIRESLQMILEYEGYEPLFAESGKKALQILGEESVGLVLLDIKMPGMDGIEVLGEIRVIDSDLPVIMISGHGTIETAVECTKRGAFDFLEKPLDRDKVLVTIRNALRQRKLSREYREIKEKVDTEEQILGNSDAIVKIIDLIKRVGPTDVRVLITGENGTGKELVARALHRYSKRSEMPFVEVNCAAIPNELLESELFGHEKGAFTGAASKRIGKFEYAHTGTLFLDEIGDMSLTAQAKVLRAIEEGKIERLGSNKIVAVDVRVIAATNKDLHKLIEEERFREDLFHRLNVIPVHIPPLRERRDDIPVLAESFAEGVCRRNGFPKKQFDKETLRMLQSFEWSGNVRELRNIVERLVIMSRGETILPDDLSAMVPRKKGGVDSIIEAADSFQEFKDMSEKEFIRYHLERHGWNISQTAEDLQIQRSHLYNKIKKYGLERSSE